MVCYGKQTSCNIHTDDKQSLFQGFRAQLEAYPTLYWFTVLVRRHRRRGSGTRRKTTASSLTCLSANSSQRSSARNATTCRSRTILSGTYPCLSTRFVVSVFCNVFLFSAPSFYCNNNNNTTTKFFLSSPRDLNTKIMLKL